MGLNNNNIKNNHTPSKVRELAYELKVDEAMTTGIITVSPNDTMSVVREILQERRISGLPVVENDTLVGIVSTENFIDSIVESKNGLNATVHGNMTENVETLYSDEPLIHAVGKFDRTGFGRLPVLERKGKKLVGILTKGDIIKCLLRKLEVEYQEEEVRRYRASHIFKDIESFRTTLILRYKIDGGNYHAAGEQSGYLKTKLLRLGISPRVVRRITVASCEAEMNMIIFTPGGELAAYIQEDKVTVNAVDEGPGIPDIEKAMQPGYSTAPDFIREMGFGAGMGLPNIKNCSDTMDIDSAPGKGTRLKFTVNMSN